MFPLSGPLPSFHLPTISLLPFPSSSGSSPPLVSMLHPRPFPFFPSPTIYLTSWSPRFLKSFSFFFSCLASFYTVFLTRIFSHIFTAFFPFSLSSSCCSLFLAVLHSFVFFSVYFFLFFLLLLHFSLSSFPRLPFWGPTLLCLLAMLSTFLLFSLFFAKHYSLPSFLPGFPIFCSFLLFLLLFPVFLSALLFLLCYALPCPSCLLTWLSSLVHHLHSLL